MIQPTELRDAQPPLGASGLGLNVELGNAPSPLNTKTTKPTYEELVEVLSELADLMDDVREGNYKPDSFTTQPAREILMKVRP